MNINRLRAGTHWDKVTVNGIVVAERQLGPVVVVMDNYYARSVTETGCSADGALEYWEVLGQKVERDNVEDSVEYRLTATLPVAPIDGATMAQLKQLLPAELGVASIGRIYFSQ